MSDVSPSQKLLGNRSCRPRTITIVPCFLAPGKLIISGQESNLFVFGSDSKQNSQWDIHQFNPLPVVQNYFPPSFPGIHLCVEGKAPAMRGARDGRVTVIIFSPTWCCVWMEFRPKIKLFGKPGGLRRWNLSASSPQGNSDQATMRIFPPGSTMAFRFDGPNPLLTSEKFSLIHLTHVRYSSTMNSAAVQEENF